MSTESFPISHPDKLLFPDDAITKGELAAYYEAVSAYILPELRGRPLTMERFPNGITHKGFIQKNVIKGFPEWLPRVPVEKKGGVSHFPVVNDLRSLLWVVNQNCITPHVWTSRLPALTRPDLCVIDLDPSREDLSELVAGALAVRALLSELGLKSAVKTSGSKGFHIVVPLDGESEYEVAWRFAHGLGAELVKRHPELFTQEFIKADRGQRILVDTGRNGHGATFAAPYAVRPKPGAPVSAPCSWEEVESKRVTPQSFTLRSMGRRLEEVGDLWQNLASEGQSLAEPNRRLMGLLSDSDWQASLSASTRRPSSRHKPR